MPAVRLTVRQKMMNILADGLCHSVKELHGCLVDDLGPDRNIASHLTGIRKELRQSGQDILTQRLDDGTYYRLVRLVSR